MLIQIACATLYCLEFDPDALELAPEVPEFEPEDPPWEPQTSWSVRPIDNLAEELGFDISVVVEQ